MNLGNLTGLGLLWLSAAGCVAWIAEKNEWSVWKWYLASFLTGPVAWVALYLKLREKREKIGPIKRPRPLQRRLRRKDQNRRVT